MHMIEKMAEYTIPYTTREYSSSKSRDGAIIGWENGMEKIIAFSRVDIEEKS